MNKTSNNISVSPEDPSFLAYFSKYHAGLGADSIVKSRVTQMDYQ